MMARLGFCWLYMQEKAFGDAGVASETPFRLDNNVYFTPLLFWAQIFVEDGITQKPLALKQLQRLASPLLANTCSKY